jgi:hypothetical protein
MEFIMEESSQQGSFKSSKSMQPLLMALKLTWFLVSSAQHKQKQDPSGIRALQSVLELVSCDGLERLVTLLQVCALEVASIFYIVEWMDVVAYIVQ